jgi:hypothetical protein
MTKRFLSGGTEKLADVRRLDRDHGHGAVPVDDEAFDLRGQIKETR